MWLGPSLYVLTRNPEHFEIILNNVNANDKGESHKMISEAMGKGLVTTNCKYSHQIHRQ